MYLVEILYDKAPTPVYQYYNDFGSIISELDDNSNVANYTIFEEVEK